MSASAEAGDSPEQKQLMSAMFASLVMQNTNMAMIFLGLSPNPQTGKTSQDLDHAQYFIGQLEMLAAKTKGNLDRAEETMLKQSLTTLHLAFVEAVSQTAEPAEDSIAPPTDEQETASAQTAPEGEPAGTAAPIVEPAEAAKPASDEKAAEMESKKKFTKKY